MASSSRQTVAERFAAEARRAHPQVRAAYLFGSVARGDDHPESDVDVLVVWDGPHLEALDKLLPITFRLLLESGEHVAVKVLSPQEWERGRRTRSSFVEAVHAEGRALT